MRTNERHSRSYPGTVEALSQWERDQPAGAGDGWRYSLGVTPTALLA